MQEGSFGHFSAVEGPGASHTWFVLRGLPGYFAKYLGRCREVCEDFRPADSTVAAVVAP